MGLALDPAGLAWEIGYGRGDLSFDLRISPGREGGLGAALEMRGRF